MIASPSVDIPPTAGPQQPEVPVLVQPTLEQPPVSEETETPTTPPSAPPPAPTSGPAVWDAALSRALGPEPQWVPPAPPWPACATFMVRRPLDAEHKRRQDAARAAWQRDRDAWRKAGQPVRDAVAAGFFVNAPAAGAPFQDKVPAGATTLWDALGTLVPTPCYVRDIRPATGSPTTEEKAAAKATNLPLTGPSACHILCGASPEAADGPTFLVTVPARLAAAKLAGDTISGWRFEPEGHFAADLRGRIATIGVGEQLEITGIGSLSRGIRDPGFGWTRLARHRVGRRL